MLPFFSASRPFCLAVAAGTASAIGQQLPTTTSLLNFTIPCSCSCSGAQKSRLWTSSACLSISSEPLRMPFWSPLLHRRRRRRRRRWHHLDRVNWILLFRKLFLCLRSIVGSQFVIALAVLNWIRWLYCCYYLGYYCYLLFLALVNARHANQAKVTNWWKWSLGSVYRTNWIRVLPSYSCTALEYVFPLGYYCQLNRWTKRGGGGGGYRTGTIKHTWSADRTEMGFIDTETDWLTDWVWAREWVA